MFSLIPTSFFFLVPIQTGAEIISSIAVCNKLSSFYALGALFTGHPLTVVEWVVNLLSVAVLPLFIWSYLGIRHKRPLRALLYAYVYFIDVFVSLGFTVYFIVHWFVVGSKQANSVNNDAREIAAREVVKRVADTVKTKVAEHLAGATKAAAATPVTRVHTATATHIEAVTTAVASTAKNLNKSATVGQELAVTIVVTVFSLLIRFYFLFVIIGYARILVRQNNLRSYNGEPRYSRRATLQWLLLRPLEKFWTGHSSRSHEPAEIQRLADKIDADDE